MRGAVSFSSRGQREQGTFCSKKCAPSCTWGYLCQGDRDGPLFIPFHVRTAPGLKRQQRAADLCAKQGREEGYGSVFGQGSEVCRVRKWYIFGREAACGG